MKENNAHDETLPSGESLPDAVNVEHPTLDAEENQNRYRSKKLLGAGGMGEVHLCRDIRIGREIALKKIKPAALHRTNALARFLREARVQGQLEHPAIVPVYDLGQSSEGTPFFTMKRVRGLTLEEIIKKLQDGDAEIKERHSRRKLLSAFSNVCLAVDYVHSRGVLHRDLKPANIMLGDFGEVHILDWGIAKIQAPDLPAEQQDSAEMELSTRDGQAMGTPGYMSPEQARGEHEHLDARADVYSLGVILFELLTLQRLHRGQSVKDLMISILKGYQEAPSMRTPEVDIPPELDALCLEATKPEAKERLSSARILSARIEDFLDGDRDLAKRRELAAKHAEAAQRALDALAAGADEQETRAQAMREATRALALDPTQQSAAGILAKLLLESPKQIPKEAEQEMERSTLSTRQLIAKLSSGRVVALAVGPLIFWLLGVKDWAPLLFLGSLMLLTASLNWLWWKKFPKDDRVGLLALGVSVFLVSSISAVTGPLIVVPLLACVNGLLFLMQSNFRLRRQVVIASLFPVWIAFGLQELNVLPTLIAVEGGVLATHSTALVLSKTTLVALLLASSLATLIPILLMIRLRMALSEVEKKLFLHSWHLQQMLPKK